MRAGLFWRENLTRPPSSPPVKWPHRATLTPLIDVHGPIRPVARFPLCCRGHELSFLLCASLECLSLKKKKSATSPLLLFSLFLSLSHSLSPSVALFLSLSPSFSPPPLPAGQGKSWPQLPHRHRQLQLSPCRHQPLVAPASRSSPLSLLLRSHRTAMLPPRLPPPTRPRRWRSSTLTGTPLFLQLLRLLRHPLPRTACPITLLRRHLSTAVCPRPTSILQVRLISGAQGRDLSAHQCHGHGTAAK